MLAKRKECEKCPLHAAPMCTHKIDDAKIEVLVIGESPSVSDIRSRTLFSSQGGQQVKRLMREAGFNMMQVKFVNALQCLRSRDVKIDVAVAVKCCAGFYKEVIAKYKPKLVIGFGNVPLKLALNKSGGIVSYRGTVSKSIPDGTLYYPCLTPEYVFVNTDKASLLRDDIRTAYNLYTMIGKPVINTYTVITDNRQLKETMEILFDASRFSFDFETTGLDPYTMHILGLGFSTKIHTGTYLPWMHRPLLKGSIVCPACKGKGNLRNDVSCVLCSGSGTIRTRGELKPYWTKQHKIERLLAKLFSNERKVDGKPVMRIAHNIGFEYRWLKHHWGIDLFNGYDAAMQSLFDTQLYAYVRNSSIKKEGTSVSLESLVRIYPDMFSLKDIWTGIPKSDSVLMPRDLSLYHSMKSIGKYCCGDCDGTLRLATDYIKDLSLFKPYGHDFQGLYFNRLMPMALFLGQMMLNGVYVNSANLRASDKEAAMLEKKYVLRLYNNTYAAYKSKKPVKPPKNLNLHSPTQLGKFLFGRLQLPKVDGSSTRKEILEILQHQYGSVFAKRLLDYRAVSYHRSNLLAQLKALRNPITHRVHASIKIWGTETGRLAISDPPLHGIPSSGKNADLVRSALSARKGYVILSADYSQIELRLIAWLSGDARLTEGFLGGKDMHTYTSSLLFNVAEADVVDWQRRIGKTCNFGLCYRGSYRVLVAKLGNYLLCGEAKYATMEEDELLSMRVPRSKLDVAAKYYYDRFHEAYAGIIPWVENTLVKVRQLGFAVSAYGRVRYLPELNSSDNASRNHAENAAVNFNPQSTASDYLLFRFLDIAKSCVEAKIDLMPLISIHDALYCEVRKEQAEEAMAIVREVGIRKDEANIFIPMLLEPKIGKTFADV